MPCASLLHGAGMWPAPVAHLLRGHGEGLAGGAAIPAPCKNSGVSMVWHAKVNAWGHSDMAWHRHGIGMAWHGMGMGMGLAGPGMAWARMP